MLFVWAEAAASGTEVSATATDSSRAAGRMRWIILISLKLVRPRGCAGMRNLWTGSGFVLCCSTGAMAASISGIRLDEGPIAFDERQTAQDKWRCLGAPDMSGPGAFKSRGTAARLAS